MDILVALLLIAGMPGGIEWLILLAVLLVPAAVLGGVFAIGYGVGRSHATKELLSQGSHQSQQTVIESSPGHLSKE